MGRQYQPIRWTSSQASAEFNIHQDTLAKRLRRESILADKEDGKFSTAQIVKAIFGDITGERLRKTREEADRIAIENEKSRGVLIEAEVVYRTYETVFVVIRQKILALEIPDGDKDELINELRALKSQVKVE